jgi:hypothetical protein
MESVRAVVLGCALSLAVEGAAGAGPSWHRDRGSDRHDAASCAGSCSYGCHVPVAGTLRIDGHRFVITDTGCVATQIAAKARWLGYDAEVCGGREVVIYARRGCAPHVSWSGDRFRGYLEQGRRKVVLSVERVKVECREQWHPRGDDRRPRRDPVIWWTGRRDWCW